MVQKPGKPEEEVSLYWPILLLTDISKLFEKPYIEGFRVP
jgi:hypothetical protein